LKLIDEIIVLLASQDADLESALIKAQVLAHKLGETELLDWVKSEVKGYADGATLPDYRQLTVTPFGNVANLARRYTNMQLPTVGIPEDMRDFMLVRPIAGSVAVIREWAKKKNLQNPYPPETYGMFNTAIERSYQVESAWGVFSEGAFTQILVEIRSRFLDFMLQLSDRMPAEPEPAAIKQMSKEIGVSELFKGAIFGDGAVLNVAVGDKNTVTQTVTNTVTKGDFNSLAAELRKANVAEPDIKELKVAVDEDSASGQEIPKNFGPKVRTWFNNMLMKAGTSAWDFSLQTGAGVLAGAISKFYGISS
jgi:hypothetical protein